MSLTPGFSILESYQDVELWKLAHRDVQALKALEEKYRDTIVSTCELPDEFESEFCHFATLMDYFCQYFLNRLGGALPASPPLRHLFIQENHGEAATIMHKENYLKNRGSSSYLMWIFHALSEKTLLCKIGLPTALDELQRLLDMDKENHDLITAKVARIISDLAIVEELMRQFEMYQPWFTMVTRRATSTDTYLVAFNKKLQSIRIPFRDNLRNRKIHLEYGDPLDGGFSYPCHKRRTKEITEKLCRAERMLDDFWAKVDTGTGYTDGYIYTQDGRTIQRTPEWSEPEPKQALVAPKTSLIPTELLSQMKLATPDDVKDQAATYSQPKVKVKTRGPQSITAAEISRMEEVVAQKDIQPVSLHYVLFRLSLSWRRHLPIGCSQDDQNEVHCLSLLKRI
jgi:hypothetical protein